MEPRRIERTPKRPTDATRPVHVDRDRRYDDEMNRAGNDIEQYVEGDTPAAAQRIANVAFREARAEGCTCTEPNIAMSPMFVPPFWRATVEHEPTCKLLNRLVAFGAPLTIPEALR